METHNDDGLDIKKIRNSESDQCLVATKIPFLDQLIDENPQLESDNSKEVVSPPHNQEAFACLPKFSIEMHLESEKDISDTGKCNLESIATCDGKHRKTCDGKDNSTSPVVDSLPNNSSNKPTCICGTVYEITCLIDGHNEKEIVGKDFPENNFLGNKHTVMSISHCKNTEKKYPSAKTNSSELTDIDLAKEHTENDLVNEHTEINISCEHTENDLANEHSEINFYSEHTKIYLANKHTENDLAYEGTETNWTDEHSETDWANAYTETDWANEYTENDWPNWHTETDVSKWHTETDFAYEHTEIDLANEHAETNLLKEHTETHLANKDTETDLANKNTEIQLANENTETDLSNENTEIDRANEDIETNLANKHTDIDYMGNKAIETNHLHVVVDSECKAAIYSDNVSTVTEINTASNAGNELTESDGLCYESSKTIDTGHDGESQTETSSDVNVEAEGLWEQTLISDFQCIRNALAQFEPLGNTLVERSELQTNSTPVNSCSTKRTKASDSKSDPDPDETFQSPSSASNWKPSVTSTDESNIISQLKEIRNELLHIGTMDVFTHDDLGLEALFQERTKTNVDARSKSSKKRKKQLKKLVNPPKNCDSGARHKRFATSFEELHQSALFLDVDVDTKFTCSVCLELYYIPTACRPCAHIFCDPCLRRLTAHGTENVPCPLCRTIIARCDVDTELDALLMMTYPEIYSHRATQEQISKYRHYKLPLTIPVPLGRRIIRQMIGSRNNQSDWSWMSHDWFKFVLGCTAGLCLALLILVLNRVRSVKDAMDVFIVFLSVALGACLTAVMFKVLKI